METAELHLLLIETVTNERECVLQFDGERLALRSWLWPQERSGALIAPENLREYRSSHNFLGPGCFCPALSSMTTPGFVEAAILQRGNSGFVAMCSTDSCGYLVFLSRVFERANMPTATYRKRDVESIEPPRVYHLSEDQDNVFGKANVEDRKPSVGKYCEAPCPSFLQLAECCHAQLGTANY
ncbi:hypothetical protein GSI_04596 [Ganoderma sinense ZZ0214-1]|uniref:Uncharacterized protein n=1 Tax=Ganoderma sinense ZZ0214-1 TaxID=1077348 RepID=A0A2G8SHA7_9APHY|nr:hypothetical protein GSI_04596 [Ganoderma sinense ZZ0214-1]